MALGTLWFARIPSTSPAWDAQLTDPASLVPPAATFVDVLPYVLLFGIGLSLVVAPLTTTLMGSVPVQRAALGSAINNAISRVGQPLLGALLFVAITGVFYSTIGELVPGADTDSQAFRDAVAPLNEPAPGVPPGVAEASDIASTDAFRVALLASAGLLVAGAVVNGVGLRREDEDADEREQLTPIRIEA
jgi:hypothetical protein